MRIIFMGTPEFAVPSLRRIHGSGHDIALVVTQPDRPAGRGRKLACPPVKLAAVELGLPVAQPESVNSDDFLALALEKAPDAIVVVAFGQILSRRLLDAAPAGAINVHPSLLPAYRGVAPMNWAIINGERETGVTTMFMAEKVDAGEIILAKKTPIGERETAGELHDRLAEVGGDLVVETLRLVERGEASRISQDASKASYGRKFRPDDGDIDWSRPSWEVYDHIRGMTPWPGAYTWYRGRKLIVLAAEPSTGAGRRGAPGELVTVDFERGLEVAAGEGSVWLTELRPEGRRGMPAGSFARGYRPEAGTRPFVKED